MTTLAEKKAQLREAFPELSAFELAKLVLEHKEERTATISELLVPLRARYMAKELRRPRAKIQPDGSMKLRDTTTYRTYETYWIRLEAEHGSLPISELTEEMVVNLCVAAQETAKANHAVSDAKREEEGRTVKERDGASSYNHQLEATAVVIRHAIRKGFIAIDPLIEIERLPISESDRHGLTPEQVDAIMYVALNGGNDPVLDYILLWSMLETACRIGGLLKLRIGDIDASQQFIRFHEKRGKSRKQPVTRALADALLQIAKERGSVNANDPVFRYHPEAAGKGAPMKERRFETLWSRISKELKWVDDERITSHWIRHTTLTWVDRVASPTVASKYAGHGPNNVTSLYTKARLDEISKAHEALFGQFHPAQDWRRKQA
jgi:integrase/recombinase XerC